MLFDPPQSFGLVLDISQRKDFDGKKLSTKIRNQLVSFVDCLEGEDSLHLYQLESKPATTQGERTALMGNWESDSEIALNLGYWLEYTLGSLALEDEDGQHYFCFLTDRLEKYNVLSNINLMRQKAGFECRFLVAGIGRRYDRQALSKFCEEEGIDFRHIADVDLLADIMTNWKNGVENGQ